MMKAVLISVLLLCGLPGCYGAKKKECAFFKKLVSGLANTKKPLRGAEKGTPSEKAVALIQVATRVSEAAASLKKEVFTRPKLKRTSENYSRLLVTIEASLRDLQWAIVNEDPKMVRMAQAQLTKFAEEEDEILQDYVSSCR